MDARSDRGDEEVAFDPAEEDSVDAIDVTGPWEDGDRGVDDQRPGTASDKAIAVFIAVLAHVVIVAGMIFIVLPDSRGEPAQITVLATTERERDLIEDEEVVREERRSRSMPSASSTLSLPQITASFASPVVLPPIEITGDQAMPPGVFAGTSVGDGFGQGNGTGFGGNGNGMGGLKTARIGGLTVRARKLGVILDVSGSMTNYLPDLKREIRKEFKGAPVRDVVGCRLELGMERDRSTIEGVEYLIERKDVDAIYWFSDLQDGETADALTKLEELLKIGTGTMRPVKFYVRIMGPRQPSDRFAEIIKRSGGGTKSGKD